MLNTVITCTFVVTVKCPCGRACRGYDPGIMGGVPECFQWYEGNEMPWEYRRLIRRDTREAVSGAGFLVRLATGVIMEKMIYDQDTCYRLYECPSCGASVLFMMNGGREGNRIQRFA